MNIRLLRRIQKAILRHPNQFEMSNFFQDELIILSKFVKAGGCGTAACIAGWAIHLDRKNESLAVSYQSASLLDGDGWNNGEWLESKRLLFLSEEQAQSLFNQTNWPIPFKTQYDLAKTAEERAIVAAGRIEHFIKTEGI